MTARNVKRGPDGLPVSVTVSGDEELLTGFRKQGEMKRAKTAGIGFLLMLSLAAALGGCGRRGAVGTLEVAISGLPAGIPAAVDVGGPNGYAERLAESASLTRLPVGDYTVSAASISTGSGTYLGAVGESPVTVFAGSSTPVSVSYALDGGGTGGDISGVVSVVSAAETGAGTEADFVPGEVIVKFRPGVRAQALGGLEPVQDLGLADTRLYRFSGLSARSADTSADAQADTLRRIAELRARPDVLYAHPNYLLKAYAAPNDPLYARQWHLRALNLPAAWDNTTGGADVTVAVVDSGVVPGHPDLAPKLLPGYDFVEADLSSDGDGPDADPTDPRGSFHGSHVAGTAVAATNNGVGVAGVSWGGRLLPVRVLDGADGTIAAAVQGILWSAGESVAGAPVNPNPADVLNLSLGGPLLCADAPGLQEAFDRADAAGTTVVVAAGNDDFDASYFVPASCEGVIVVGATTYEDDRAPYSNYGERVDVMAPGGDLDADADADGFPDGVLSTVFDPASGENTYAYFQGTSMAAPHVAGLVALMKSIDPALTTAEVRDVLTSTATPLTGGRCADGCGAGLVDAAAALGALGTPVTPDFDLSLSPAALTLAAGGSAEVTVLLSRSGGFADDVTFSVAGLPVGLSAGFAPPATGGDSATLTLAANTDLSGSYTLQVQGVGGGVSKTAALTVTVGATEPPPPAADALGAYVFYCPFGAAVCTVSPETAVVITESGPSAPYVLRDVPPGSYQVLAWKDLNENRQRDDNEPFGRYLNARVAVTPPADAVDVTMIPALGTQGSALPTVTVSPGINPAR